MPRDPQYLDLTQELNTLELNIAHVEISFYGFRSLEHSRQYTPYQQSILLNKSNRLLDDQINKYSKYVGNYKRQIQDFIVDQKRTNSDYKIPAKLNNQMEHLSDFQERLDKLKPILKQRFVNDAAISNDNASSSGPSIRRR